MKGGRGMFSQLSKKNLFAMKVLLNLSIQFLATRDKILSIDHYVTEEMKSDAIFTFQLQHGRGEQSLFFVFM